MSIRPDVTFVKSSQIASMLPPRHNSTLRLGRPSRRKRSPTDQLAYHDGGLAPRFRWLPVQTGRGLQEDAHLLLDFLTEEDVDDSHTFDGDLGSNYDSLELVRSDDSVQFASLPPHQHEAAQVATMRLYERRLKALQVSLLSLTAQEFEQRLEDRRCLLLPSASGENRTR